MEWWLFAALGIIWGALLLPIGRRRASPGTSVQEFERRMGLLAYAEGTTEGRWIVTPQKGIPFLGTEGRARARARERRRRVFVFLLESIGLTFLIGLVPPLRAIWAASAALAGLLVVYVWILLTIKARASGSCLREDARANVAPHASAAAVPATRYVAGQRSRHPRPAFSGLGSAGEDESVHVVVMPAGEALSSAGA